MAPRPVAQPGQAGRPAVPPPPPPPLPADVAALRSQLQRANSRCHELLCERARREKLLQARERELHGLRLQLADLVRLRGSEPPEQPTPQGATGAATAGVPAGPDAPDGMVGGKYHETGGELGELVDDTASVDAAPTAESEPAEVVSALELAELRAAQAAATALQQQLDDHAGLADELAAAKARIRELEAAQATRQSGLGARVVPQLADISGIGPKFQERLAAIGVDVMAMAAWSDEDVARFAKRIRTQPARILRQGWVAQAKALIADSPAAPGDAAPGEPTGESQHTPE